MITVQFSFPDQPTAQAALPFFLLPDGTWNPSNSVAPINGGGFPVIVSVDDLGEMDSAAYFFGACQKNPDDSYTVLAGKMPTQVFE